MSKIEKEVLDPDHAEAQENSVYDFLYNDTRRVGAFLSQFDDAGLLEKNIQSEGAHRGGSRGLKAAIGGSLPGVGSANLSWEHGPQKGGFEAAERIYDPLWQNSLSLLDFLADRKMIVRDNLAQARIGQFVLLSGSLSLYDLKLLRDVWEEPFIKRAIKEHETLEENIGNRQERRATQKKRDIQRKEHDNQTSDMLSFMKVLPHLIQMNFACSDGSIAWGTLNEAGMVGSTADLFLKHGVDIEGTWFVLGVVDALPKDDSYHQKDMDLTLDGSNPLSLMLRGIAQLSSAFYGKQPNYYGIMPVMIFRQVAT